MEQIIIIIFLVISIIIIMLLMKAKLKELEKIALDEKLNKIGEKYPSNVEICKAILKKLRNEDVKIEENPKLESTLYIAIQNKILIGNMHNSFVRIQTIAHECLHSVQDKKILIFNFIYSNIYLLYFLITSILVIIKKLPNELLFSHILLILSFIYYVIRIYLENDAMIKAEFLSKEYIEENGDKTSKEEIKQVEKAIKKLNNGLIKTTNCSLFIKIMIKIVIFNGLALIF